MIWLVAGIILVVTLLIFAGSLFKEGTNESIRLGGLLTVLSSVILFIIVFLGAPVELQTGLPMRNINPGEYKVGFVYIAGENVNVWVEIVDSDKIEHLYFYQFNKNAFDGDINAKAKKLTVVESGDFKKLQLK